MTYEFYRVLHLVGIFMLLLALGGVALHMASGGTREFANRKWLGMLHGIGLLLIFVAGFGLIAKLSLHGAMPGWVMAKMVIWVILGAIPAVFYRKGQLAKPLWFGVWVLASLAAFLAIYKPF